MRIISKSIKYIYNKTVDIYFKFEEEEKINLQWKHWVPLPCQLLAFNGPGCIGWLHQNWNEGIQKHGDERLLQQWIFRIALKMLQRYNNSQKIVVPVKSLNETNAEVLIRILKPLFNT